MSTKKKRKPWTQAEVKIIRTASREHRGVNWARTQMRRGRTAGAIRQKAFSMGLSLNARKAATAHKTAKKAHKRTPKPATAAPGGGDGQKVAA